MAVKASVTITISKYRDTDSITRFYKLQASTASAPAKPTTLTPSGWTDTEPTYTSGSTNTLYFTDRYIFSDGTFQYTEVSKSTSYEAAKEAYNKAQAAQDTADTTQNNLNNLQINTGNLWFNGQEQVANNSQWDGNMIFSTEDLPDSPDIKFKHKGGTRTKYFVPFDINKSYKLSAWFKAVDPTGSSNSYPSIAAFDIDKIEIGPAHVCPPNNKNTMTTLTQDLKNGDTIVYAEDLSNWKTSTPNDYNVILGIYDYKSNSGILYNDYTRHLKDICSYGDVKTNYINKTNNTITLKTAYTGKTVPAGTRIAQHRYAGSYIYPFGGFQPRNYQDTPNWHKFEKIISYNYYPNNLDSHDWERLRVSKYIKWSAYDSQFWVAGLSLTDVTNEQTIAKTVKTVDVEYYLSTSSTECSGGSWSTTAPAWVDGKYMWSRQKVTFVDNTTSTTNTTCIAGAKGSTGSTGTGIDSITEEYYLSTSKTSQTGGSWSTTPPSWSSGKYIWTRSKIVYKNPASTVYTTPLCSSEWEAVNELEIGGRNYYVINKSENGYVQQSGVSTLGPMNSTCQEHTSEYVEVNPNEQWIFQVWVTPTIGSANYLWMAYQLYDENKVSVGSRPAKMKGTNTGLPQYEYFLINIPDNVKYMRVSARLYKDGKIKLEKGNKPTDWSPAPEDVKNDITNAVDNIEIGGRNLIRNSSFKFDLNDWKIGNNSQYQYELVSGYNDAKALKIVKGDASSHLAFYQFLNIIIKANTMLTASMKVKTISGNADNLYMRFTSTFSMPMKSKKVLDDDWVLYTYQGTPTSDIDTESISFGPNGAAGEFIFDDLKLEYGNKPTDWTAAPEDTDTEIQLINTVLNGETGINARLTSAETTIDSIRGKIVNQVIDANGKVITTQTSNGLSINLSGITNDVSQLLSDMTTKEDSQDAQAARQLLQDQLSKLQNNTAFIRCYQELEKYIEDNVTKTRMVPIIELGSNTSPFHLKINNEGIYFVEGYPTFVLTTSEPSDWNTNYNDYYTLSEDDIYVQVQTLVAPTWEADKYYEKDTVNENIIAFANGKAFYNLKTVVQKEIKLGSTYDKDTQDFVGASWSWVSRENGNLGLVYSTGQTNS